MRREVTAALTASLVVFGQAAPLLAYTRGGGRGSVSAASRSGGFSHSGGSGSWQGGGGSVSGSRNVTQTGEGYNVRTSRSRPRAAPRRASTRTSTPRTQRRAHLITTNAWGQSASRERTVEGRGATPRSNM